MFRITPSVIVARTILYRHPRHESVAVQFATITRSLSSYKYSKSQERLTCPPPPPQKPKKIGESYLLWGSLVVMIMAGGFAVYAKTNPELRDWLTINAPWMDEFIAIVHEENKTYKEFAISCATNAQRSIEKFLFTEREPQRCTKDGKLLQDPIRETPVCDTAAKTEPVDKGREEKEVCRELPPPIQTKDICEVEACLKDLGDMTIFNYLTARDACRVYNNQVAETMEHFSVNKLKELRAARKERKALVKKHVAEAQCSLSKLDELARFFDCGVTAPKEAIKNTKDLLKEYSSKIKDIRIKWQWENDKSLVIDTQWRKVEEIIDKYVAEVGNMMKEADYTSKKPHLRGDPDLLLLHTKKYVERLRIELNDALAGMLDRVNRGIDNLPVLDDKGQKAREKKIAETHKKMLADLDAEFVRRASDHKVRNDEEAKKALANQMEKSQQTLQLRLEQKTEEATKKLKKMVAAQVQLERKEMATEKENMSYKLKLLEEKLEARLKAEKEARRSQDLWTAGYNLLKATKKGDLYVRVDKEIKAIEKASGDDDKLVLSVLKAIPDSVRKRGVMPESVIREKYHVMEDVALKVALVEQEGAPLPVFILSFMQSLFLFMKISGIPQKEYDEPPKKPPKDLDTFDLLQRARFWIDRGDIAGALKYVSALEGASRAAAESWRQAARAHLETRQAAEAVLAHATALGLQYI